MKWRTVENLSILATLVLVSLAGHYCDGREGGREGGSIALIMMLSIARVARSNLSCSL